MHRIVIVSFSKNGIASHSPRIRVDTKKLIRCFEQVIYPILLCKDRYQKKFRSIRGGFIYLFKVCIDEDTSLSYQNYVYIYVILIFVL